jgi:hypothetical protein
MSNQIQPGTMMVYQAPNLQSFALESTPYFRNWSSLGTAESSGLGAKVRDGGWNLFFIAGEFNAMVPAWGGSDTLRRGVKRLLARTRLQHFNCLEVTDIRRKYFLGIPYLSISANPRHIQLGSRIESMALRIEHEAGEARFASA